MKSLHNTDANGTTKNVSDVQFFGNVDAWQLICKASSEQEGWMKSTKAMDIGTGCLVQVTTQQRNQNGSYSIAEAITFVPGVCVFVAGDTERGVDRREIVSARTPEPQPETAPPETPAPVSPVPEDVGTGGWGVHRARRALYDTESR